MNGNMKDFEAKVIQAVEGDLVAADDGFFVYWPTGQVRGYFTAEALRAIANHLDKINAPWQEQIKRYYADKRYEQE